MNWIPNLDKPGQVYWLQGIPGGGKGLCSWSTRPAGHPQPGHCAIRMQVCARVREQSSVPETALAPSCLSWHGSLQSLQCCGHQSGAHRQPLSPVAACPIICFPLVSFLRLPQKSSKGIISALTRALALGVSAALVWEIKQKWNFLYLLTHTWALKYRLMAYILFLLHISSKKHQCKMLCWELEDNGKFCNTQCFQITVRGTCASTNANRFSKSYDSDQEIITE